MSTENLNLCVMDIRRSPTQAPLIHRSNEESDRVKTVSLKFYTGDLWIRNPDAHLWIMVDGYIDHGDPRASLKGRGVAIGHTPLGTGIAFEHFGEKTFMVGDIFPWEFEANEFYDIVIECSKKRVQWRMSGPDMQAVQSHYFSKWYPSYDTVVGVAGDRQSSTYGFFNMVQTLDDTLRETGE